MIYRLIIITKNVDHIDDILRIIIMPEWKHFPGIFSVKLLYTTL